MKSKKKKAGCCAKNTDVSSDCTADAGQIDNPGTEDIQNKKYTIRRRVFVAASVVVVLGLFTWLVCFLLFQLDIFQMKNLDEFEAKIASFGAWGWLVAMGIQILQVVVALIPGEIVEVGSGAVFGFWGGTAVCMLGAVIGSALVFLLVRRFGVKLVEVFISREKINSLRFLKDERRLKSTIFLVFFIIGTPKDLLTYFAGLTNIKLYQFLLISTVARIPSVVTSTLLGKNLLDGNWIVSVIIFAATAVLGLAGVIVYNKLAERKNHRISDSAPADSVNE